MDENKQFEDFLEKTGVNELNRNQQYVYDRIMDRIDGDRLKALVTTEELLQILSCITKGFELANK